jgi:hypothetical protein
VVDEREAVDASAIAARWTRVLESVHSTQLRVAWLRAVLREHPVRRAAAILDAMCADAETGAGRAVVAMHALVELFADPTLEEACDELRAELTDGGFVALGRVLRRPFTARSSSARMRVATGPDDDEEKHVPDYGKGRTLTLGERKALARLPPRELLPKVLADPHPDVIRNLLASSRLTEDHVVRLCTKRPGRPEVLAEVARHPRWCHRVRIRMALVLNPATPTSLAVAIVALLRRAELHDVLASTSVHPVVRSAAHDRLARIPPLDDHGSGRVQ